MKGRAGGTAVFLPQPCLYAANVAGNQKSKD